MSDFKQLSRSVKGLTVLVTGAAGGMGRATARVFAAEGANVAVTDTAAEGARAVSDSDAGRADYLKRFYGISEELPTHYDLVVNTDAVSVEQAAGLISLAASQ